MKQYRRHFSYHFGLGVTDTDFSFISSVTTVDIRKTEKYIWTLLDKKYSEGKDKMKIK